MEKQADNSDNVATSETVKESHPEKAASISSISHRPDELEPSGLVAPTEMNILRHVPDKIKWSAYMIAFVELAERFSYYGESHPIVFLFLFPELCTYFVVASQGSTVVFVNFIQQPLPPGSKTGAGGKNRVSGALGQKQETSTGLTTFLQFWAYFTPLLGAYIADEKLGRFRTIAVAVAITLVGHVILIISAIPPVIVHPKGRLQRFALPSWS
ncbi:hypothetical protein BC826DRAFT_457274 [Russula brevipes]|nr:hypothetical protein BC826DRAFT_457274 [Russula brevipes]